MSVNFKPLNMQARFASTSAPTSAFASRTALAASTAAAAGSAAWYFHLYGSLPFLAEASANTAAEVGLHPAALPFEHKGLLETYNHGSIRRGYQGE
jgi:ubiquinol-cytochrome c reductase cytochrome c1 subunit